MSVRYKDKEMQGIKEKQGIEGKGIYTAIIEQQQTSISDHVLGSTSPFQIGK